MRFYLWVPPRRTSLEGRALHLFIVYDNVPPNLCVNATLNPSWLLFNEYYEIWINSHWFTPKKKKKPSWSNLGYPILKLPGPLFVSISFYFTIFFSPLCPLNTPLPHTISLELVFPLNWSLTFHPLPSPKKPFQRFKTKTWNPEGNRTELLFFLWSSYLLSLEAAASWKSGGQGYTPMLCRSLWSGVQLGGGCGEAGRDFTYTLSRSSNSLSRHTSHWQHCGKTVRGPVETPSLSAAHRCILLNTSHQQADTSLRGWLKTTTPEVSSVETQVKLQVLK